MEIFKHIFVISSIITFAPQFVSHVEVKFCATVHHIDGRNELVEFFNLTDSLNVTWMHATNSPEMLQEGLNGEYMMLEADVLTRNNLPDGEPIMAHPPATDSNLTLAKFLEQTLHSSKGIKLDFKTIQVLEPSLKLLLNMTLGKKIFIPIWINADIVNGPCYTPTKCKPVDAHHFLELCHQYTPNFTLSIGWKTEFNPTYFYNWSYVIPMGQLLLNVSQPVTFPIRYSLVERSLDQLEWLMDLSPTFTMTIWSSVSDEVNPKALCALRLDLIPDKRRIYYDLPADQMTKFVNELKTYEKQTFDNPLNVIKVNWQGYATNDCTGILIGTSSIMFTEQGGWATTDKENKPIVNQDTSYMYMKHIKLTATVLFIDDNKVGINKNISFVLHSTGVTNPMASFNRLLGTRAVLQSNGNFLLNTPDGAVSSGRVKPSNAYEVMIIDFGDGRVEFEVKPFGVDESNKQRITAHNKDAKLFYTQIGTMQQDGPVLVKKLQMSFVEAMAHNEGSNSMSTICDWTSFCISSVSLTIGFFALIAFIYYKYFRRRKKKRIFY